jgi:dihydroxyacetone kinase
MMTSLDMHGFSVSVYPANGAEQALLAAQCGPAQWPGCRAIVPVAVLELPDGLTPIRPIPSEHAPTAAFLTRCCNILIGAEVDLNALDAKSGDGDTGSTLAGAARALIGAMDRMPLADHTQLYRAIGQELSQTMGGSSGVLLAIFFTAAGDAASSGLPMVAAFKEGLKRMQQIGGAEMGDRTMIDALKPALDALEDGIAPAADAARKGAIHTSTIVKAKAGRATYINAEQLKGHNDPGAEAVARLFEQLCA